MFKKISYLRFVSRVNKINNACTSIDINQELLFVVYHILNQPFIWKKFKNTTKNRYCKAQIISASLMVALKTFIIYEDKIDNAEVQSSNILKAVIVSLPDICKLTKDETTTILKQSVHLHNAPEFFDLSLKEYISHIASVFAPSICLCKKSKKLYGIQNDKLPLIGFADLFQIVAEITVYLGSISEFTAKSIEESGLLKCEEKQSDTIVCLKRGYKKERG